SQSRPCLSTASDSVLPEIRADERTDRHDAHTFGAGTFDHGLDECLAKAAAAKRLRHFCVQQPDGAGRAFVGQKCRLSVDRKLEAAQRAVVGDVRAHRQADAGAGRAARIAAVCSRFGPYNPRTSAPDRRTRTVSCARWWM